MRTYITNNLYAKFLCLSSFSLGESGGVPHRYESLFQYESWNYTCIFRYESSISLFRYEFKGTDMTLKDTASFTCFPQRLLCLVHVLSTEIAPTKNTTDGPIRLLKENYFGIDNPCLIPCLQLHIQL